MTRRPPPHNPILERNVRLMMGRYTAHLESGNHILREGSQQEIAHSTIDYFREVDPETYAIPTNGHYVAPGGLGKTITGGDLVVGINTMPSGRYVLGDPALGKRILIAVPTNGLVDQWANRLLGEYNEEKQARDPSIFGDRFTEENVGIYHAGLSDTEKANVLSKPIVIGVHDSLQILCKAQDPAARKYKPLLSPQDFDLVIIDEVDDKVRGDVTRQFYLDTFFPHCMIVGCTATPLFKSGRTIGDYLFGGKKPICEIPHEVAVQRREIAPHINIIVEPKVDLSSNPESLTKGWDDYTPAQQRRFIEQTGIDQALLKVIALGTHPKTGKPLRDMMQLHQAVNIEHAELIAAQLNAAFGPNYAEPVWGGTDAKMDEWMRRIIKWEFGKDDLRAVVQCMVWGRGTDFSELEMTVQHAPSLSPNKTTQFHTRASRRDDGTKTALYLSPFLPGIDQLVIGELLGGLYMIPPGFEFSRTTDRGGLPSDREPWPEIEGVNVYYTERHLKMFAKERKRQREIDGLQEKTKDMMTLDQMSKVLKIDASILYKRVYGPLQEAYERRQARQEFIDLEDVLHVRGKIFPVRRMGFYQHDGQEVFCVDRDLVGLCEHTLYGRLDHTPMEVLDKKIAQGLLGCGKEEIDNLWAELQQAFFDRKPYETEFKVAGVDFSYNSFGFFRRQREGTSEFFIFPDALIPAYRKINGVDVETAQRWAEKPSIRQCKTADWYTAAGVMKALQLNLLVENEDTVFVAEVFEFLEARTRTLRVGQERDIIIDINGCKQALRCSRRWLPMASAKQQTTLVIDKKALQWISNKLDEESTHKAQRSHSAHPDDLGPQPNMRS